MPMKSSKGTPAKPVHRRGKALADGRSEANTALPAQQRRQLRSHYRAKYLGGSKGQP